MFFVGEDHTRGNDAASDRENAAPSGWVTTQVAAKSLGISPRTVRWHIEHGNLEAKPEGEGVRRSWLVSIDSVQAFRDSRHRQGQLPGNYRVESGGADIAAESSGNAIRELADKLVEEAAKASEYRVRLELSEKAQSTLEEQLTGERRRREDAERARDELRRALEALREAPEEAKTIEEAPQRVEPRSATGGAHEDAEHTQQRGGSLAPVDRLPWWQYVLGLLLVFLGAFMFLSLSRHLPIRSEVAWQAIYLATGLLPPSVFGFWVGFRQRNPRLRSGVIRIGALVGVAFFLGLLGDEIRWHLVRGESLVEAFAGFGSLPLWIWAIVVPVTVFPSWLLYVSGALIGNAWQRHRSGRMPGTPSITEWTPRKQAFLGFAGTVVGAAISVIGALLTGSG
jgi:hypothetical protein